MTKPGGFRVRFYIPSCLARLIFAPMEPLLPLARLPAFISRESVSGGEMNHAFFSAKAQRELGWSYRPARIMWPAIIDEEIQLLAGRKQRDLVSRLNPVEIDDQSHAGGGT